MAGEYPKDLKYTKDHEWARKSGGSIVVGVTFHAQESLGDVVYVELPKLGAAVKAGERFGTIESTKAVSDLYSPITGKVVKVNDDLTSNPQKVNQEPYAGGWIIEVEASGSEYDALMDAATYEKSLATAK
jgi:glycine cleavage system H protein